MKDFQLLIVEHIRVELQLTNPAINQGCYSRTLVSLTLSLWLKKVVITIKSLSYLSVNF